MAGTSDTTAQINLVAIDIGRYWNAVLIEVPGGKRHRFRMANSEVGWKLWSPADRVI